MCHSFGLAITPCYWDLSGFLQGILLGSGLCALSWGMYIKWPALKQATDEYLTLILSPLTPRDLFWIGLLPGVSEELLFRGVALPHLGLVSSSLLFGLVHFAGRRYWPYSLWAGGIGLMLGAVTLLSGNLLLAIVAHSCNNWLAAIYWRMRLGKT